MLYPKHRKLSSKNNTEVRIHKMDTQRALSERLINNLENYIQTVDNLIRLEHQISEDFLKIYTTNSVFGKLIFNLNKCTENKYNSVRESLNVLKVTVERNRDMGGFYNSLKPLFKQYFAGKDKEQHYKQKLPDLEGRFNDKQSQNKELTLKEKVRLERNKKKLEDAVFGFNLIKDDIKRESDTKNIHKYSHLNQLLKQWIDVFTSQTYSTYQKIGTLNGHSEILSQNEKENFNNIYFSNEFKEDQIAVSEVVNVKPDKNVINQNNSKLIKANEITKKSQDKENIEYEEEEDMGMGMDADDNDKPISYLIDSQFQRSRLEHYKAYNHF